MLTPNSSAPVDKTNPLAVDKQTLIPVKDPGPHPAATCRASDAPSGGSSCS